jgi:hypothetical protein
LINGKGKKKIVFGRPYLGWRSRSSEGERGVCGGGGPVRRTQRWRREK